MPIFKCCWRIWHGVVKKSAEELLLISLCIPIEFDQRETCKGAHSAPIKCRPNNGLLIFNINTTLQCSVPYMFDALRPLFGAWLCSLPIKA